MSRLRFLRSARLEDASVSTEALSAAPSPLPADIEGFDMMDPLNVIAVGAVSAVLSVNTVDAVIDEGGDVMTVSISGNWFM